MVKQASARANREIGVLDPDKADLIDRAAQLVIDGEFHDQFVVGVIQGGAGTSTNMNANEVITNIALELAGREKGDYAFLSPIDDTNRSQSTNDVYPTAIKIGLSLDAADACWRSSTCCASRSSPRRSSSTTCSRSVARSCRMPCR